MPKPVVNASRRAGAAPRARTRPLPDWPWVPRRPELLERVGPPLLTLLCWIVAAVIAVPLLLGVLAPFLVGDGP